MRNVVNKRGSRQGGDVPAWIDRRVLLVLGLLATLVVAGYAAAPAWWAARGLPNGQAASDYAAANQGQLKNMAKAARAELVAQGHFQLTDTHAINTLVDGWSANNENATDYAAANLGQLKAVARLFYDALYLDYPWPAASPAANDYAVANIGQLKAVFAFQVGAFDSDADGLPDGWERKMFGDLDQSAGDDFDQDGLTDSQEFALGTSPKLQDTDADGMPDAWEQQYSLNPRDPADAGPAQGRVVRPEEPLLPQSEDYTHDYGNGPVLDQFAYSGAWVGYAEAMTAYHAIIQAADRMDVDKEGLSNLREYLAGTHPRVVSTDGDLYSDYEELAYGSDPLVAASIPPVHVEFSNAGPSLLKVSTFRAERSVGGEAVTVVGAPDTQFFSTAPGGVLTPGEITVTTDAVQHFATVWVFAPKGVAGGRNETVTTEDNLTGNGNGNGNSQTGNSHTLSSYQWRGNLGLSLNPTMPGPSPESAAPPEGLVFTAHRKRKLSYSARQLVSPATEEYGDPSPIGHQWLKPAGGVPAYSDDGFNGDADPLGNNDDPGDPRDGITSATGALVPASPDEPGAHQVETGGARSVRIIGPYGTPTGLIGTYTATNAYSPPDTIESNGDGGFNPGQAVGKLEGVSYFQGASTNGWQGNGEGGVASYTVASTWSTATEQAPTVTYTNPETGDTGTSSATYQTQGASMEQVEVRLQTNKEVEVDKPVSRTFVLTKTTTPMEGGTTSSEFAAMLRLTISSGKLSNVCEVVSGTLPGGVTTQGGVVSMRSPAPVAGNNVSFALLPIDIKWEAKPEFDNLDDNPDPWTNKTNGKRIMVGAPENDHNGDMRRELNVKVSIPGYANQPVYLNVFDVDDPSTVSDPGDKLDPNDDAGDDNMHAVGQGDNWGHFIPQAAKQITVTLNSSGETTATFKVNQQPGNNYRVAVAIKNTDLNVLQVTNPDDQGFVTPDDKSVSGFNGAITPMLTVWRKLHIEVDSMEAVSPPKGSPDRVDAVGDHWAIDASGLQNRHRLYLAESLPEGNNFYQRGRLKAGGAEYKIVGSGSNWVTLIETVQSTPPGFIGPVEIYDDDDRGLLGPPLPKRVLITEGVKDIFKRAYIAIEERSQNPTKTIPFKLYTSVAHPLVADSSLNNAIDTNGDDWGGFWNHYLIAAYQPHQSAADDPGGDSIEGCTSPTGYGPRYSVIFVETIRDAKAAFIDLNIADFDTRIDEVVAHEIGHGPNDPGGFFEGSHPESGLMGDGAPQHHFSAESLKRFRQAHRWQEP